MKRNRRRRGFDEERKRQLRNNLRDYFISSKHLTYGNNYSNLGSNIPQGDFSEAAFGSADHQLDPQGQLEKAKQANYNFGDIGITPESANQNGNPQQEQRSPQENQQETLNNEQQNQTEQSDRESSEKEQQIDRGDRTPGDKADKEEKQKPNQEEDTSPYTRYQLEQLEKERENEYKDAGKIQTLVDLPAALESDNRELGHSVKAFADPYLILKELLWMAGRQNPNLDVIQRLWLVWTKWYSYYSAWYVVNRDEERFLPGSNRILVNQSRNKSNYQYRGIHELETCHLENSMLQVMRWEFARKTEMERQFNPMPNLSQLHGYFVGLRRRQWDSTSWQYRVNLGAQLMIEEVDEQLQFTSTPDDE